MEDGLVPITDTLFVRDIHSKAILNTDRVGLQNYYVQRDLYKKVGKFDWSTLFDNNKTFAIDSVVYSTIFKHSKFVALRVKDAIADQFKEKFDSENSFVERTELKLIESNLIVATVCAVDISFQPK